MRNVDHPDRNIWATMRKRCNNTNHHTYEDYGGKGITVCPQWSSFVTFTEDMGPRPAGYTLERIDSRGNYEPTNCKWASRVDQNNNRSINRIVEYRGGTMTLAQAMQLSGCALKHSAVLSRMKRGWDLERALTEPKVEGEELLRHCSLGSLVAKANRDARLNPLAIPAKAEAEVGVREILTAVHRWFQKHNDGRDGCDYMNGDSTKYPGNGYDDAEALEVELVAALANLPAKTERAAVVEGKS